MEVKLANSSMSSFSVRETSQIGEVRRAATTLANSLKFDETHSGRVAVVATELSTNLANHARGGHVFIRPVRHNNIDGVELLSVDHGPGMADVERCRRDGFSTAGTPGMGLGAIQRMSDSFHLESELGEGTVAVSKIWSKPLTHSPATTRWEAGLVALPYRGESVCGDAVFVADSEESTIILMADGLGHGPVAAQASSAAGNILATSPRESPKVLMDAVHGALRATRGAAAAIVELNWRSKTIRFCGVGNIAASLHRLGHKDQNLISDNGIVGHKMNRLQELQYELHPGAVLVMNSDGLKSGRRLDRYPGFLTRDVSLMAGLLFRDNAREKDDATVLILRERDGGRS